MQEVLYRKWRPKNLDQVVGQEHMVKTLEYAIEQNRLSHAYLFCGPRGTGKTSTARILAKSINCKTPINTQPCDTCATCISFNKSENDLSSNIIWFNESIIMFYYKYGKI